MKYLAKKYFKSTWAAWSSEDTTLYKELSEESFNEMKSGNDTFGDEYLQVIKLTDKTFEPKTLSIGVSNSKDPKYLEYIQSHKNGGWKDIKEFPELEMYFNRQEIARQQERKNQGYIFWKDWDDYQKEDSYGGFSDKVVNHPEFQSYASRNPFGYVGHSIRKKELDRFLEDLFLNQCKRLHINESKSLDLFINWLTSTDGRHMADWVEGSSFDKQREYFSFNIDKMLEKAIIYSNPNHTGNLTSFLKLQNDSKLN